MADWDGRICGYAVLNHITKPENPFMYERDYLDIDEFCVDRDVRRQKVATKRMAFLSGITPRKRGIKVSS